MRGRPDEIAGMLRSLTGWTQEEIRDAFGGECVRTTPERANECPSVRRQTFKRPGTQAGRERGETNDGRGNHLAGYMRGWGRVPPLKIQWTQEELASMRAWDRRIDQEAGTDDENDADAKEEDACEFEA